MPRTGPLIPGLREYDAPRHRRTAPWLWLAGTVVVLVVVVVAAGLLAGVGPLRALGAAETPLKAVAWRPTAVGTTIQVAVAVPPSGLCAGDEVTAVGVERGPRIEVSAVRVQPRTRDVCSGVGIAGDRVWVDVTLDQPVGQRTLVRAADRFPLPKEGAAATPSPAPSATG